MKQETTYKKLLQGFKLCLATNTKISKEMATQKGIIKLKGTIGDITFYKTQDGNLARLKGGVEKNRILNDPALAQSKTPSERMLCMCCRDIRKEKVSGMI